MVGYEAPIAGFPDVVGASFKAEHLPMRGQALSLGLVVMQGSLRLVSAPLFAVRYIRRGRST